jgi:hypothetical protein
MIEDAGPIPLRERAENSTSSANELDPLEAALLY